MSDLYDDDVLQWSEQQANLLRRHAAGEKLNPQPDWANIIEEIESVGRSELTAVQSLLVQGLVHDLRSQAWPNSPHVPHWRAEARGFRDDAARSFSPSMRQRIDVAQLYRQALRRLPDTINGQLPEPVPHECSTSLSELLGSERD